MHTAVKHAPASLPIIASVLASMCGCISPARPTSKSGAYLIMQASGASARGGNRQENKATASTGQGILLRGLGQQSTNSRCAHLVALSLHLAFCRKFNCPVLPDLRNVDLCRREANEQPPHVDLIAALQV